MDFYSNIFSDHRHPGDKKRFMDAKRKRKTTTTTTTTTTKKKSTTKKPKTTSKTESKTVSSSSAPGTYKNYKFKKIKPSKEGSSTKYDAYFINTKNDKEKVVSFGSRGAKYYPDIQDKNYKNYILKHHPLPDKIDLMSKKALERYILWNKTDIKSSVESYKKLLKSSG